MHGWRRLCLPQINAIFFSQIPESAADMLLLPASSNEHNGADNR
jgi:hypothetical protein